MMLPFFVFHALQNSVLRDLSSMQRLVVATGGGAVIRPVNWYLELTLSPSFKWVALFSLNQYCDLSLHYQEIYEEGTICLVRCALGCSC